MTTRRHRQPNPTAEILASFPFIKNEPAAKAIAASISDLQQIASDPDTSPAGRVRAHKTAADLLLMLGKSNQASHAAAGTGVGFAVQLRRGASSREVSKRHSPNDPTESAEWEQLIYGRPPAPPN